MLLIVQVSFVHRFTIMPIVCIVFKCTPLSIREQKSKLKLIERCAIPPGVIGRRPTNAESGITLVPRDTVVILVTMSPILPRLQH
jgi:hypothetical protein